MISRNLEARVNRRKFWFNQGREEGGVGEREREREREKKRREDGREKRENVFLIREERDKE